MQRHNKISAIVPNFNHAPYLALRLNSIINQTVPPDELIFIDDASSDNSIAIAEEILSNSKIPHTIVKDKVNSKNVFKQWLKGIELAKYNLIWIAESDDMADLNFLAYLKPLLEKEEVMAAFGKISYIDEKGRALPYLNNYYDGLKFFSWDHSQIIPNYQAFSWDFSIKNVIPNVSGLIFRKPKLTPLECERLLQYKFAGDWYLYSLMARGGAIAYNKDARSSFRLLRTSVSQTAFRSSELIIQEHKMILEDLQKEYGITQDVINAHVADLSTHLGYPINDIPGCIQKVRPLRIGIIACGFMVGGGEVLPLVLANTLKDYGYHITYLIAQETTDKVTLRARLSDNIPVCLLPNIKDFSKFVKDYGLDAINSHNIWGELILYRQKTHIKIPYIVTLHGSYECASQVLYDQMYVNQVCGICVDISNVNGRSSFVPWIKKNVGLWLYTADKNTTILQSEGIPVEKFRKVSNAILETLSDCRPESKKSFLLSHGIAENTFILFLCSRAIPEKGWDIAINILDQLNKQTSRPVHLFLIGDGDYLTIARHLAISKKISNITFMGSIENPSQHYHCFDLAIFPTTFSGESFPLFLLECFSQERPVVTTSIGEIPTMMGSVNVPGFIVPHNIGKEGIINQMTQLVDNIIRNEDLYHQLCMNTKEAYKSFGVDKFRDTYVEVFNSLTQH